MIYSLASLQYSFSENGPYFGRSVCSPTHQVFAQETALEGLRRNLDGCEGMRRSERVLRCQTSAIADSGGRPFVVHGQGSNPVAGDVDY